MQPYKFLFTAICVGSVACTSSASDRQSIASNGLHSSAISKLGPLAAGERFKPAIKRAYATNPKMKGAIIRVDANTNGSIYLWGKVRSPFQKTLAWRIAKHIAPGLPVVNLVRVQAK